MTALKQETIKALENLLGTKALCINSDLLAEKYDLENPSVVFELDEDDSQLPPPNQRFGRGLLKD